MCFSCSKEDSLERKDSELLKENSPYKEGIGKLAPSFLNERALDNPYGADPTSNLQPDLSSLNYTYNALLQDTEKQIKSSVERCQSYINLNKGRLTLQEIRMLDEESIKELTGQIKRDKPNNFIDIQKSNYYRLSVFYTYIKTMREKFNNIAVNITDQTDLKKLEDDILLIIWETKTLLAIKKQYPNKITNDIIFPKYLTDYITSSKPFYYVIYLIFNEYLPILKEIHTDYINIIQKK